MRDTLPEAVPLLRTTRNRAADGSFIAISAVDPLNLAGTLLPGEKVPALPGNRVLYRDGLPVGGGYRGENAFPGGTRCAIARKRALASCPAQL